MFGGGGGCNFALKQMRIMFQFGKGNFFPFCKLFLLVIFATSKKDGNASSDLIRKIRIVSLSLDSFEIFIKLGLVWHSVRIYLIILDDGSM